MSKAPWIRWFTSDWVAATFHLSPVEEGVYSKLIQYYYLRRQPLPASRGKLHMIARATDQEAEQAVEDILG